MSETLLFTPSQSDIGHFFVKICCVIKNKRQHFLCSNLIRLLFGEGSISSGVCYRIFLCHELKYQYHSSLNHGSQILQCPMTNSFGTFLSKYRGIFFCQITAQLSVDLWMRLYIRHFFDQMPGDFKFYKPTWWLRDA